MGELSAGESSAGELSVGESSGHVVNSALGLSENSGREFYEPDSDANPYRFFRFSVFELLAAKELPIRLRTFFLFKSGQLYMEN